MRGRIASTVGLLLLLGATGAGAGQIVQVGYLSGYGDPQYQGLELQQFDTMAGTRELNYIQIDLETSVHGGFEPDGSGIPVHVFAKLVANYYSEVDTIAFTRALIDMVVPNDFPGPVLTVFDVDSQQVLYYQPADMAPWIGDGTITLSVFTELEVWDDPPGIINFGAGGSIHYSVTYDYSEPTLFADGFESGDMSNWSAGNP